MAWHDYEMAQRLASLWVHAMPNSPWALWNLAKAEALLGHHSAALARLEEAHRNGMAKLSSLQNDPAFAPIKANPRFKALCQKLAHEAQK